MSIFNTPEYRLYKYLKYYTDAKECSRCTTMTWKWSVTEESLCSECTEKQKRDKYYKKKYGISYKGVMRMFLQQKKKCKICGVKLKLPNEKGSNGIAVIDHCHDTDNIRGLLCTNCNTGIGKLGDNVESLRRAVKYLENAYET